MKFLLVEARYYPQISDALLFGASAALDNAQMEYDVIQVPGALEIAPAMAMAHHTRPHVYQGFVALGCVIRGETSHYDIVANQSAAALQDLSIRASLAIGNGILTCDNIAQAQVRADPKGKNKGGAAVNAAVCLALFQDRLNNVG